MLRRQLGDLLRWRLKCWPHRNLTSALPNLRHYWLPRNQHHHINY